MAAAQSLADKILEALEIEGPQTTWELTQALGVGRSEVGQECRELEDAGSVISVLEKIWVSLFPLTGEIVTPANRDRIHELAGELRAVIGRYRLPGQRAALAAELTRHFEHLLRRPDLRPHARACNRFAAQMLAAVNGGETRSQLEELVGPRSLRLNRRLWGLPEHAQHLKLRRKP